MVLGTQHDPPAETIDTQKRSIRNSETPLIVGDTLLILVVSVVFPVFWFYFLFGFPAQEEYDQDVNN